MLSENVMIIELLPDTVDALGGNTSAVTRYPEEPGSLLLFRAGSPQDNINAHERIKLAVKNDFSTMKFTSDKIFISKTSSSSHTARGEMIRPTDHHQSPEYDASTSFVIKKIKHTNQA
jgi:hypothetical protein